MAREAFYHRIALCLVLAAGLLAYASLFRDILIDDTFITLIYARNLAEHFSWGFAAGEPMNTATSALNVIGLAAATVLVRDPVRAALVFSAAIWLATILLLGRIGRRLFGSNFFALLCAPALLANPLLISTLGLESYLYVLLFVAALDCHIRRRWTALPIVLGLLTLTRFDGILAAAVFWLFTPGGRHKARFAAIYAATVIPWHLFAWIHLGSLLPDTLFIKIAQPGFEGYGFGNGLLLFAGKYPLATAASFLLAPAAVLVFFIHRPRVRRATLIIALYGIVHYAGYSALGVPPYHWYYTSTAMCVILLAGLGLAGAWHDRNHSRALLACIPALPVILLAFCFRPAATEMPIQSNWATCGEYAYVADQLAGLVSPGQPILCHAEIGTLAYFGRLNLRNEFSDRAILKQTIDRALKTSGARHIARFNFYWRDTPPLQPMTHGIVFNIPTNEAISWSLHNSWMGASTLYFQEIAAPPGTSETP